ncbi:pentapeptide repeat-containing protein (plasmid) [Nocardiopsis flavescens]|nr:pentapeptide repeat-containing protein [Nocardiopsis flavescens]
MTCDAPASGPLPSPPPGVRPLRERAAVLWGGVRGHPLRSCLVLGAVVLIVWAGAPLAHRFWEVLWSLPQAGRVVGCVAGVLVIVAVAARGPRAGWRRRGAQARLGSLIAVAWAVVVAVVVLLVAGAWWVMGAPEFDFPGTLRPRALDALATRAFAIVAGLGAAALLVIHYRRQRTTEADAERAEQAAAREVAKLFTDTFDSASDKLGSDHAAVRLAGVHALARLADEAPEGREDLVQMVIDVLCAYVRLPYAPAPGLLPKNAGKARWEEYRARELEFAAFREVRHTIIRIIGRRLREDTRWRGKDYDFTGAVFDGGNLFRAVFSGGRVSFRKALFHEVSFRDARFVGGEVTFAGARFTGGEAGSSRARVVSPAVDFRGVRFTGGRVSFRDTWFAGGEVSFLGARFTGGEVDFSRASGERPAELSEAVGQAGAAVVVLPERWRPACGEGGGADR